MLTIYPQEFNSLKNDLAQFPEQIPKEVLDFYWANPFSHRSLEWAFLRALEKDRLSEKSSPTADWESELSKILSSEFNVHLPQEYIAKKDVEAIAKSIKISTIELTSTQLRAINRKLVQNGVVLPQSVQHQLDFQLAELDITEIRTLVEWKQYTNGGNNNGFKELMRAIRSMTSKQRADLFNEVGAMSVEKLEEIIKTARQSYISNRSGSLGWFITKGLLPFFADLERVNRGYKVWKDIEERLNPRFAATSNEKARIGYFTKATKNIHSLALAVEYLTSNVNGDNYDYSSIIKSYFQQIFSSKTMAELKDEGKQPECADDVE